MRQFHRVIHLHWLAVIALVLCAGLGVAHGDDRIEARTRFQAGKKAYAGGDYRSALKEFNAAQNLAPADLNYYNLALCHDKLGEAEPAIQNYREYLRRVPDAPKRFEIEASIARLDDALKSAATKAEVAKRAEEDKRAQEVQQPRDPPTGNGSGPVTAAQEQPSVPQGPTGAGGSGTPSTGAAVPTGDAQLDRVSTIHIDAIRDQRGMGARPTGAGPGATPNLHQAPAANPTAPPQSGDAPAKVTPIYKEWWFWAIVAVGAIVVYEVASGPSSSPNPRMEARTVPAGSTPSSGLALFRF